VGLAPLDLRLTVAAPTAWFGSLTVWAAGPVVAVAIATASSCAGGFFLAKWLPGWPGGVRRLVFPVAAFALVALAAGILTTSLAREARMVPEELVGKPVRLTLEITSGSKPLAAKFSWQSERVRLHAKVRESNDWILNSPVVVFADARWANIPIGATVSARGTFVPSDRQLNGTPMVAVSRAPRIESAPGLVQSTMNELRDGLRLSTSTRDPDGASLVAGLAIGDESGQSPKLSDAMLRSGLSHLTAVSGGNTAIVLILVLGLTRFFPTPIWFQAGAGGIALLAYLILVGPQPSVLRATVMGAAVLIGLARGGLVPGLPVLSLAAFSLLLLDPALAVSLGFGLSVVATAGLLLLAPTLKRGIAGIPAVGRAPRWFHDALAVTVSAQIATAPLLLAVGNDVSLAAVPANLLVAPVVAPITISGLLAAVLSPLALPIATAVAWPAALLGDWIAFVANVSSSWGWAAVDPSVGVLVIVAVLGALALVGIKTRFGGRVRLPSLPKTRGSWFRAVAVGLSGCAVLVAAGLALTRPAVSDWRVVACDVGQGSATLVRAGESVILVDAGPRDGGIDDCLNSAGVFDLMAVVITHLHADHVDGLADVLSHAPVESLFATSAHLDHDKLRELGEHSEQPLRPEVLAAGQRLSAPGLTGQVLWPRTGDPAATTGSNNGSLVIKFRWDDGFTLLVTGDVETEAQHAIVSQELTGDPVHVVTVPHHGSSNLDPDFARRIAPNVGLVSVGADNEYGHPSEHSMTSFESAGATLFRTDESGSLEVAWREGQVWVGSL
jgi:competence protein ComEC